MVCSVASVIGNGVTVELPLLGLGASYLCSRGRRRCSTSKSFKSTSRRCKGHGNRIHLQKTSDSPFFVNLQPPQCKSCPIDRLLAGSSLDRQHAGRSGRQVDARAGRRATRERSDGGISDSSILYNTVLKLTHESGICSLPSRDAMQRARQPLPGQMPGQRWTRLSRLCIEYESQPALRREEACGT